MTKAGKNARAYTLIELMVGMMITSIIFAAVGTIAYAMSTANTQLDEMCRRQAHIRYASLRLSELFRNSIAAWQLPYDVAVWTGDTNQDGQINANEVVYIETDSSEDSISLVDFPGQTTITTEYDVENGYLKTNMKSQNNARTVTILGDTSNVWFDLVNNCFLAVNFDIVEDGKTTTYRVCSSLEGSAGHLLVGDGGGGGESD